MSVTLPGDGAVIKTIQISGEEYQVLHPFPATAAHTVVNVTTSSAQLVATNASRRTMPLLYNASDTTVWIAINATPVATAGAESGIPIPPQQFAPLPTTIVDTRVINAVHAGTGNKRVVVTEWSL